MSAGLEVRAAQLRSEFDARFAEPPRPGRGRDEHLLVIEVGDRAYAVRVAEIAGLVTDRPVTPLPVSAPELLGLAGYRGAIFPVYDLAALVGHGRARQPRWLLLTAAPTAALAFDELTRHLRVPELAADVVQFDGHTWPVLSIPSLLRSVADLGGGHALKER